jgi:hypothetical protein
VIDHLQELGLVDNAEDLNEEADAAIISTLTEDQGFQVAELIMGLSGLGVYALGRRGRGKSGEMVDLIVQILEQQAIEVPTGITWETPAIALTPWQKALAPEGYYNIGMAHGVGGVIAFLAEAASLGFARAVPLLEGAVQWLLAQEQETATGSWFASWVPLGHQREILFSERLSWCYGTLGLSAALFTASRRVGRPGWGQRALGWARQCAVVSGRNGTDMG